MTRNLSLFRNVKRSKIDAKLKFIGGPPCILLHFYVSGFGFWSIIFILHKFILLLTPWEFWSILIFSWIFLSLYLSIHLSIYLFVCLSTCLNNSLLSETPLNNKYNDTFIIYPRLSPATHSLRAGCCLWTVVPQNKKIFTIVNQRLVDVGRRDWDYGSMGG